MKKLAAHAPIQIFGMGLERASDMQQQDKGSNHTKDLLLDVCAQSGQVFRTARTALILLSSRCGTHPKGTLKLSTN